MEIQDITINMLDKEGFTQKPSYFDFRIGWMVDNSSLGNLATMLRIIGKVIELDWAKAKECGECPNEDVSPAEAFYEFADKIDVIKSENLSKQTETT